MTQPIENSSQVPPADKQKERNKEIKPPSNLQATAEENKTSGHNNNSKKENSVRTKITEYWMGTKKYVKTMAIEDKSAFWTMVFTALLTAFTFLLFRVSDSTDKAIRVTQRAFVNYQGVRTDPANQDAISMKIVEYGFNVNWENSGTTPTRNATMHVNHYFAKEAIPKGWNYPDLYPDSIEQTPAHVVLGPKGHIATTPTNVPTVQMQTVSNKMGHYYFYGWLMYNDVFGKKPVHITEFCTEIVVLPGQDMSNAAVVPAIIQSDCPEHNCYDTECTDYAERTK
jgi:hypothetical protein